jgi:hypothetical protein
MIWSVTVIFWLIHNGWQLVRYIHFIFIVLLLLIYEFQCEILFSFAFYYVFITLLGSVLTPYVFIRMTYTSNTISIIHVPNTIIHVLNSIIHVQCFRRCSQLFYPCSAVHSRMGQIVRWLLDFTVDLVRVFYTPLLLGVPLSLRHNSCWIGSTWQERNKIIYADLIVLSVRSLGKSCRSDVKLIYSLRVYHE